MFDTLQVAVFVHGRVFGDLEQRETAIRAIAGLLAPGGTISFADALQPAIELATAGLPVSEQLADDIAAAEGKLRQEPEAARIFLPGGTAPQPGDLLPRPDLRATLKALQEHGWQEMYTGALGRRVEFPTGNRNPVLYRPQE